MKVLREGRKHVFVCEDNFCQVLLAFGSGSIVRQKAGSLSCTLVKQVSQQCAGVVPTSLVLNSDGPRLSSTSSFYYFDGSTSGSSPTHDPCGENQANQLTGVANPHGNVFVR